jgi:hypothetical protein
MYLIWETRTLISNQPHDVLKAEVTKHNHALNVPSPTPPLLRYVLQNVLSRHRPVIRTPSVQSLVAPQWYHGWSNAWSVRIFPHKCTNCCNMFVPTVQFRKKWARNFAFAYFTDKLCFSPILITILSCNLLMGPYRSTPGWHLCH